MLGRDQCAFRQLKAKKANTREMKAIIHRWTHKQSCTANNSPPPNILAEPLSLAVPDSPCNGGKPKRLL